jgi:preprotein translocase subunit SecA
MRELERVATLRVIDEQWKEHLYEMDLLKEGIGLRAYGQKDPLIEYKKEGFEMFTQMLDRINEGVLQFVYRAQPQIMPQIEVQPVAQRMQTIHESSAGMGYRGVPAEVAEEEAAARRQGGRDPSQPKQKPIRVVPKVGRNDPCPCGSGLKYKYCHGRKK